MKSDEEKAKFWQEICDDTGMSLQELASILEDVFDELCSLPHCCDEAYFQALDCCKFHRICSVHGNQCYNGNDVPPENTVN